MKHLLLALCTRSCWLVCAGLLALLPCLAQASGVLVLASRSGGVYDEVIEGIRAEVGRGADLRVQYLAGPAPSGKGVEAATLVVAVGVDAASVALASDPSTPVLCVLIPRVAFEALAARKKDGRRFSAIYLDTPYQRQFELIRALLPQARHVGTVLGAVSVRDREQLRSLARERGLNLQTDQAQRGSELYPVLKSVLDESDVFLAVPDPVVMNAATAQNVLITAFRSQVPVIGYSASYVKAGALAAVYSTPQQIGTEAGQIIKAHVRGAAFPAPKPARLFSVGLNASLMRTLGLPPADEQALEQRLLKAE